MSFKSAIFISTIECDKNVDYISEFRVIGGEPLMYKRIDEVIKKSLTYKNFGRIVVYTNGTITPKPHKLEVFKNDKILFRISDYGSISRNVKQLEKALEENKINFITERMTKWQDAAKIKKFDRPINVTKQIYFHPLKVFYLSGK